MFKFARAQLFGAILQSRATYASKNVAYTVGTKGTIQIQGDANEWPGILQSSQLF